MSDVMSTNNMIAPPPSMPPALHCMSTCPLTPRTFCQGPPHSLRLLPSSSSLPCRALPCPGNLPNSSREKTKRRTQSKAKVEFLRRLGFFLCTQQEADGVTDTCMKDETDVVVSCWMVLLNSLCESHKGKELGLWPLPECLALKHENRILGHSSNTPCGFSMMEQGRESGLFGELAWFFLLNQIQGWSTVRESYSRA